MTCMKVGLITYQPRIQRSYILICNACVLVVVGFGTGVITVLVQKLSLMKRLTGRKWHLMLWRLEIHACVAYNVIYDVTAAPSGRGARV